MVSRYGTRWCARSEETGLVVESGRIRLPTNEHDENTIHDVRYVPLKELPSYGFSGKFTALAASDFPDSGRYVGLKANIGL